MMGTEKEVAIAVKNISKRFRVTEAEGSDGSTEFWALRDVSFEVCRGDVMGIVGSNGSGKSTLLKILGEVMKPTSGEAHFSGTVTSILNIGDNFHPDLSGRENVNIQLKLKNINTAQFADFHREIHAFSEIGDFFDRPVKIYSNGMFLRLAFSIALHLSSDILILDEVLSVGDEGFRLKCQELLRVFTARGKTILFVSHNRTEILELANTCLWLDKGRIKKIGRPALVLGEYFAMHRDNFDAKKMVIDVDAPQPGEAHMVNLSWNEGNAPGNEVLAIRHLSITAQGDRLYHSEPIRIRFVVEKKKRGVHIGAFFFLQDVFYQPVMVGSFLNNSARRNFNSELKDETGLVEMICTIPPDLLVPGKYFLLVRFGMEEEEWNMNSAEVFRFSEQLGFTLHAKPGYIDFIGDPSKGSVRPPLDWEIRKVDG